MCYHTQRRAVPAVWEEGAEEEAEAPHDEDAVEEHSPDEPDAVDGEPKPLGFA
jgi:cytochrome c556